MSDSDSDPDRTHYRDNTRNFLSFSDSEPEPSELDTFESPQVRADETQEWILGGSGPESNFLLNWRRLTLGDERYRESVLQADELQRQALANARRRLDLADEPALDTAFMADHDHQGGAAGGPPFNPPPYDPDEAVNPPRAHGGRPQGVPVAEQPAPPPPGGAGPPPYVGDGGAGAREPGAPPPPGARRFHPEDFLFNQTTQNARAIEGLVAGMQQLGQVVVAGFRDTNRQQQEQFRQFQQQQQQQFRQQQQANNQGNGRGGGLRPPAPAAHRPPKIDTTTFPSFDLPQKENDYFDAHQLWSRQVRNLIMANQAMQEMPQASLMAGILASLRGDAAVMCQHMTGETYEDVEGLLAAVGNVTCGGAAQAKAINLFNKRYQSKNEDINRFCASLEMLFNRAYEPDQRSHHVFERQFLIGLRDREVVRLIIERDPPIEQNIPALRNAAVTITERRTLCEQSEQQHKQLRQGRQNPQGPAATPARSQVEPMDVSSTNKPNKSKNGRKQGQVSNANANAANKGKNSQSKSKNGPQQSQKSSGSGGNQTKTKGVCFVCGSKDHYADKCPSRGKGANAVGEPEVIEADTWQGDGDGSAACVGPLHLNLSNLNL